MKRILVPRFDNIGDLVLLQGLLAAAVKRFPETQFTVLVRHDVAGLCPLFSLPVRWQPVGVNPYRVQANLADVELLKDCLAGGECSEVWFTAFSTTWADTAVSRLFPDAVQVKLGSAGLPVPASLQPVLQQLGLAGNEPEIRHVECEERQHELVKYARFWEVKGGAGQELPFPELRVPKQVEDTAASWLGSVKLKPKKYVACFPYVGTASYRAWPEDRFVDAIVFLEKKGLRVVLMGHENEASTIERIREQCVKRGASPLSSYGGSSDLSYVAALIAQSRFYFGNDTGPMHIACALGVPVAALFGGGTWPRFLPFGQGAIAFRPMPCYGCGWDCCFGEAPCVQDLPFAVVREMLGELTAARPRGKATPGPALRYFSATRYPAETETWIKQASANYRQLKAAQAKANEDRETLERLLRESEADRAARLQTVSDLQKRLEAAEADRQARLEVIEDLEKRLGVSDADREARLKVIQDLQTRLEESEADRQARLEVIQDVQRRLEESDADRQARLVVMNNQVARLQELEAELAETRRYDVRTFPGIRLVAKKGKKP